MFAHLFNSHELSDIQLHLVMPSSHQPSSSKRPRDDDAEEVRPEEGQHADGEHVLRSYRAHAVLLATASPVLNAHIQRWSSRKTIRVVVQAHEAQAAEDVLRNIYDGGVGQPASDADVRHLFSMFVIADRLEVASVRDAVLTHAKPASVDDVNFVLTRARQAAPSLWRHAQMLKLRDACSQHVLSVFGDVAAVLHENGTLLAQFRGLCFQAVSEFAHSDQLRVHSETDVLVLLSAWVRANEGCGESQLESLMRWVLRPLHLSASYFANLATLAPWAFHASAMAALTYCRIQQGAGSPELKRLVYHAKCRDVVSGAIRMTWPVCSADLQELFQRAAGSTTWSLATYHHGYMWQVGLSQQPNSTTCGRRFFCSVQLRADLPSDMLVPGARADMPHLACLLGCRLGDEGRTERCISTPPEMFSIVDVGRRFHTTLEVPVDDIGGMAPFTDAAGDVPITVDVRLRD